MTPKEKQKARSRAAPAAGTAAPALRVTPPLGPLCEDTREHLWSCISADLRAVRAAACLNKEWRVAAVEHGAPLYDRSRVGRPSSRRARGATHEARAIGCTGLLNNPFGLRPLSD